MPFILLNKAERLPLQYEEATIYYHRLTYTEREEVAHLSSERGTMNLNTWALETAKRAVNGWDGIYGADLQPIPVPIGPTEHEQRARLAAIVEYFPAGALQAIASAAYTDSPEELKKSYALLYPASSSSPTDALAVNSPATTAATSGPTTPSPSPAIPEG